MAKMLKTKHGNNWSISPKSPAISPSKRNSYNKVNRKNKFLMHVFKPVTVCGSSAMSIKQSVDPHTYMASPKIHICKQKYLKERK